MIRSVGGGKFRLYTHDGSRPLGPPTTYERAAAQERAIHAAQARRARGNPAGVPLDLYDRVRGEQDAVERYAEILQEALRAAYEKTQRVGRALSGAGAESSSALARDLAALVRDLMAARFVAEIADGHLFLPRTTAEKNFGRESPRAYGLRALMAEYEALTRALEQWIAASFAGASRGDVRAWVALQRHGANLPGAQKALQNAQGFLADAQREATEGDFGRAWTAIHDVLVSVAFLLESLGRTAVAQAFFDVERWRPHDLQLMARRAAREAERGPAPISRAATRAEQNHLAALERGEPRYPDESVYDVPRLHRLTVDLGRKPGTQPPTLLIQFPSRSPLREWDAPRGRASLELDNGEEFTEATKRSLWADPVPGIPSDGGPVPVNLGRAYSLLAGAYQRAGIPLSRVFSPKRLRNLPPV